MNYVTSKEAKETILNMFVEPIAKHFLDSGSTYGYKYEKNQSRDLLAEPLVTCDNWGITINTVRYLIEQIGLKFDDITNQINNEIADNGWHWVYDEELQDYINITFDSQYVEFQEMYNTYNYDSYLDTVLIVQNFKVGGDYYVLLQVHGGADVRGGYTDVKCFKTDRLIDPLQSIYGTFNGMWVSNMYDGFNLRYDDDELDNFESVVDLESITELDVICLGVDYLTELSELF